MHQTQHDYYIRCVFDSDVHLIATDTTGPQPDPGAKPNPEVKPNPETKPNPTPKPKTEKPAAASSPAKTSAVVKHTETVLPATGDNGAMAVVSSAVGVAIAAIGVTTTRSRNR